MDKPAFNGNNSRSVQDSFFCIKPGHFNGDFIGANLACR